MSSNGPRVAILMATYNGAAFLDEQLESIADQRDIGTLDLFASDDGSKDNTRAVLEAWAGRWNKGSFSVADGPRKGFAENFRGLASFASSSEAKYFAFADQDDIWDADKLAAAIAILSPIDPNRPGLYFSRTRLVDALGKPIGFSPLFSRPPDFRNAIVQSIGGGNTIVMNRAAFLLFAESARRVTFLTHDWWAYMLISGAGGFVHYDPIPHIGYRQHGGNVIGKNTGLVARLSRLGQLLEGSFALWSGRNLAGLAECSDLLRPSTLETMEALHRIRAKRGIAALMALSAARLYRQTWPGNIALQIAASLGKI